MIHQAIFSKRDNDKIISEQNSKNLIWNHEANICLKMLIWNVIELYLEKYEKPINIERRQQLLSQTYLKFNQVANTAFFNGEIKRL